MITELEKYVDMTFGNDDKTQSFTPPVGDFWILRIEGQAAFDANCKVKVLFDNAIIWGTNGSSEMNRAQKYTGDAVKKVELVLDATNMPSGSSLLGGYVRIRS